MLLVVFINNGSGSITSVKSKKQKSFITTKSQTFNILIIYVISIILSFLISIFFTFDNNEYTALAFKPTVPSEQTEDQQQEKQPTSSSQDIDEYVFVKQWGSEGTDDGQFYYPRDIELDSSSDYVYVVDSGNNRIQKFDSNGIFITKWSSNGTDDGQFIPYDIAVDSSGNVYVADTYNHRIQVYTPN